MKTCSKRKQRGDRFRNFNAFWDDKVESGDCGSMCKADLAQDAWNYQQKYIELLETKIRGLRNEIK